MRKEKGRQEWLSFGKYISDQEDKQRGRSGREGKEFAFEHAEFDMPEGRLDRAETHTGGSERSQDSKQTGLKFSGLFSISGNCVLFSMVIN